MPDGIRYSYLSAVPGRVSTYVRMYVCTVSGRSEEGYAENVSPGSMVIVMECCTYDQEISFL